MIWTVIQARIGWTLADLAIGFVVLSALGVFMSLLSLPRWLQQRRCKHETYHETQACDAICSRCGKNLGFIGSWHERKVIR